VYLKKKTTSLYQISLVKSLNKQANLLFCGVDFVDTFVYHTCKGPYMKTSSSIKKWGNSLAVRIPTAIAQDLGLSENSSIQIVSDGVTATIQPKKHKRASLDELVAAITPKNTHKESDWGESVGNEAW
jgi:antitoxin MazE